MYEFYKNTQGETIEGYLGTAESFNGFVFILREPNSNREQPEEFWFKKVLDDSDEYHNQLLLNGESYKNICKSKRASTKYKNRFSEMLKSVGCSENSLNNAVFCNIHPEYGDTYKTAEYSQYLQSRSETIINFLSHNRKALTIFTCIDIYNSLKNYFKPIQEDEEGIKYQKKTLKKFKTICNSCEVVVYEIYHPSFSGKIISDN
ncbi:MAG: hypothetical protein IJO03_09455 [Clostridia bacterium]|nr:hypothetical protein [Clostridia bacterium]